MDLSITHEKQNDFLKRKELTISIKHDKSATPSKSEIKKFLAEKNSVDESQVVIDYVFSKKGTNESFGKIKILNEKPPVTAQPEPKKEETKKEEPKEEIKQESKQDEKKEGENVEAQASKNE